MSTRLRPGPIARFLLLFLAFHLLWALVYFLSDSPYFRYGLWRAYGIRSISNSIGFVAFYLGARWLFPAFILPKKYYWLTVVALGMIVALGKLQYMTDDWEFHRDSHPVQALPKAPNGTVTNGKIPGGKSLNGKTVIPAVSLNQPIGATIRDMFNILVYLLLGLGYAYMQDWFVKDRRTVILEREKVKAELALLRYQLNPHFLFNTIHNIYYLAIIQSEKTADSLLKLSVLLRYILDGKEEMVPLDREVYHLEQFIQLHQLRFPEAVVDFHTTFKGGIGAYRIAPLLLITFAENAFKHGEPGTVESPLTLELQIREGVLTYTVVNRINVNHADKEHTSGIGLPNLERRLSLLYPGHYTLSAREDGAYYRAELQLTLRQERQEAGERKFLREEKI